MQHGIAFTELLAWIASETDRYERWFAAQPAAAWAVPVGSGRIATVRDLLHHAFVVDLRLAQRVHGLPLASDDEVQVDDPMALFALARRGQALLREAVDGRLDLDERLEWRTAGGSVIGGSRRKIIAHSLTHHLRHLAQAATLLRQHGFPTDWMHDLLVSDAMR